MVDVVQPPARTIVLVYRDSEGKAHRKVRVVSFVKGFGSFVVWEGRKILVDPLDKVVYAPSNISAPPKG